MGGRVVQKYIESPLLLRRQKPQARPTAEAERTEAVSTEEVPTKPVPTESLPTEPLPTEPLPMESAPTESVPTELVPMEAVSTEAVPTDTVPMEPSASDPDPRWHPCLQRDRFDGYSAPGSRRRVPQSQRESTIENNKADVGGAINRTAVPCLSHSETDQELKPSGGTTAGPFSLPLRRLDERDPECFGGKEQRVIGMGPPSPGATKFDLRVWVLVTSWKPLEAFWFDECYLRVCPQSFNLHDANFGNPDVHLTNLCARRPADRALKASAPSHEHERRRERRRPFSASHAVLRCSTNNQSGHDCRIHVVTPADGSAESSPQKRQKDEMGALRRELNVEEGDSEGFVASQAELIDSLGELDTGGGGGPPGATGGFARGQRRARGERLWKSKVSPSIRRVIKNTLLAAHSHVRPRTSSFQLFGFDVLLDQELAPCEFPSLFRGFAYLQSGFGQDLVQQFALLNLNFAPNCLEITNLLE